MNRKRQLNMANRNIDRNRTTARSLSQLGDLLGMETKPIAPAPISKEKPLAVSVAEVEEYLKTMGGGK